MTANVDHICDVYKKVASVPTIARGRVEHFKNSVSRVSVDWSQKDLIRSKKMSFNKNYYITIEDNDKVEKNNESIPEDTSRIELKDVSDDGKKTAVLVKEKKESSEESQYIEVWNDQCCQTVIAVKKFKKQHGKILSDATFSSFLLSPSGNKLLYVAEKVEPKMVSYFDTQDEDGDGPPSAKRGAEYVFSEDWGEQEVGIKNPVVVVLDLSTEICSVMTTGEYADISMGQAVWCHDELGVVFVGWDNLPRRLGIIYCSNRRSALYHTSLENGTCTRLTDGKGSICMPRFNPQGTKLIYLESMCGGPHHNCAQLNMIRWNDTRSVETIVEIVRQPSNVNKFPGIYSYELPKRCWHENGNIVYFSSQWYSKLEMLCVDTDSKSVDRLKVEGDNHSKVILDVCGCVILACSSSPTHPPSLAVGVLAHNGQTISSWTTIASASCDLTSKLTWDILSLKPTDGDQLEYEAILVTSVESTSSLPPLLVFPHGGPHSAFNCEFHQDVVFMASLGFVVLMVNYRGSPGFGKDGVDSLLGKVGTQEISDVHSAALHVIKLGKADGDKVVVSGGSHGGFISIHLVGQYPDFYKATSIRNPVVDMARMFTTSDIPDWCCTEAGVPYDLAAVQSSSSFNSMLNKSPIIHADKIKAPVLIELGEADLRCPPSQGKELYFYLKAAGKKTKLLMYPKNCHPIAAVDADADAAVNKAIWLLENL